MSLKVWLPLNGDLENKGCSGVEVVNNGATLDNNGKIGKCYYFNGTSSNYMTTTYSTAIGTNNFSISLWLKIPTLTSGSYFAICSSKTAAAASSGFGIYWNQSQKKFLWSTADGSTATEIWMNTVVNDIVYDKWIHLVMVRNNADSKKGYFYINNQRYDLASIPPIRNITTDTKVWIGRCSDGYYPAKMYVNDFRIYDHALSAAEVKEISQGLVLHYKLDKPANINNNLYVGSEKFTGSWGGASNWTTSTETYQNFVVKQRSNIWGGLYQNVPCTNGDIFTISFYAKVDSGGQIISIHRSSLGNVTTGLNILGGNFSSGTDWVITTQDGTQWNRYWATVQIVSTDITYLQWRIENNQSGKNLYICGIKLEKGIVATPWSPAASEAGETNIIQDNSGYNNNGTILNTISISSDTPRYLASTKLETASSMINCGRGGMVTDSITVNFWFKSSAWANPVSCTEGGGWNFEGTGDYFRFPVYVSGVGYKYGQSSTTKAQICNNQWHMLTGIYDRINQKIKIYVDGQLDNDYSTGTSNNIGYNSTNVIWIGAEATGSNTTASNGMAGLFSDFRIYCTPLLDSDIKMLYNTSMSIDNLNNVHSFEFESSQNNEITKTGISKNDIIEPYITLKDGSYWKLLLFHYVDHGNNLFTSSNATYCNDFGLYSRLREINNYTYNGKYEYYVNQDGKEFRWTQTSSPTASSISGKTVVSGYLDPVNGLAKGSQSYTYLGYEVWWGACGCWTTHSTGGKTGIPGFGPHNGDGICENYLALYTRIEKDKVFLEKSFINASNFIEK